MAFLAGQKLTAAALNKAAPDGAVQSAVNLAGGTTTSQSFTNTLSGSGIVSQSFTAPPSGKIRVTVTSEMVNDTAGKFAMTGFDISGAAGTVPAKTETSCYMYGTNLIRASVTSLVTGLTPGAAGTVTMNHLVNGGTGTFNARCLLVEPVA